MRQIVLTLVASANELMPEGGRLIVSISNVSHATGYSGTCFRVPAGEYGVLTVSAHGTVSDEQLRARALTPFVPMEKRGSGVALSHFLPCMELCERATDSWRWTALRTEALFLEFTCRVSRVPPLPEGGQRLNRRP
jgi:hypothetical protein